MPAQRQRKTPPMCEGVNEDGRNCVNFARKDQATCRWHDPEVMALREAAREAREQYLKAAKSVAS